MPPRVLLIAAFSCGSLVGLLALGCSETNEPRGKNAVTVADMQEKRSAAVEPRPKPSAAALAELLAHYDPRYDPAAQMLRVVIGSPSDHSQLPPGTVVHPTRESLIYALALLERDDEGDAARATKIVRRVVALQDADPSSPTFGVWSWHAEEPLAEMSRPDLNWADFCGVLLAQMLVQHVDRLPADLRDQMRTALGRAAEAIRRRDIGAAYTNIAIVGGSACAAAGELLDDPALLEYGRRRLRSVVRHAAHHGVSEYNSPNYTRVAIAECERALQIVRDGATREAAESLRRTLWQVLAESFHQPTQQIAGPHSRSSSDRLRPREIAFLSQRIGVPIRPHPTVIADRGPDVYAVLAPLPCPAELATRFAVPPDQPREIRRTFLKSRTASESIVGTTWMDASACLGSVSRSGFWTQRRPLLAYWHSDRDPAAVFRLRFLRDGGDFASMGMRAEQSAQAVVCVLQPLANRGDRHRTLDRPADGVFHAEDFRARFEVRAKDARSEKLSGDRYVLASGGHRVVIHAPPSRFAGSEVQWRLGGEGDRVFLDAICHSGERRAFDFDEPLEVVLAAAMELLRADEPVSKSLPSVTTSSSGSVTATWPIDGRPPLRVSSDRPPQ